MVAKVIDPKSGVSIDADILETIERDTLSRYFWRKVGERGEKVAMRVKHLGIWNSITWRQYGDFAKHAGLGFAALGARRGDVVSIISEGNPQWLYADLGAQGIGAVTNGIYTTDSAKQVAYIVNDSKTVIYIAENDEQLDKILEVRDQCPSLRKIVIIDMEGLNDFSDPMVISFDELLKLGREFDKAQPKFWDEQLKLGKPDDLAILIYTSGTTGAPKGAMISNRNLVFQMENAGRLLEQVDSDEQLSFLPLCHIAERGFSLLWPIRSGSTVNFAESPETVPQNLQEVQPTVFFAVPRLWEKFYSGVAIRMKDATGFGKLAYKTALGIGYKVAQCRLEDREPSAALKLAFWFADQLVLKNIKRIIGIDRCKWLVTGAAPISPDLIKWYLALGKDMREVYGQTENVGLATSPQMDRVKLGTIGMTVPNTEVKLSPEGEILLRGPHVFMGYLNNPTKTAETIVDGWLHTGDVGTVDNEGWYRITDRMKDIIITAGGKNITPSEIENQLKFSPYVSDAVVIGDRRQYLTCLVMIDHDNVVKFAQDLNVPFTNFTSLCHSKEVQELIWSEIEKVNKNFARVETIKKFRLIDRQLTAEDDELTPTMKLKRKFVNEKYKPLIEEMYASA
ncbi:long-chain fatty acid--CoA ligase [Ferrovibrio terrae]|uniref:Long-chain fatty acid--CoA ligase n=1 Tax=Ferrovibrio terrae TaxID=2594003 RepID=A0A516GWP7_9PROT|nr:AMP-binding protein [Ferrovibrio terrae]QDO95963.1 long-chain fatty acid--CoA ligase [Ferrovibrio terrae]